MTAQASMTLNSSPVMTISILIGTAHCLMRRQSAYLLDIISTTLFPALYFATWYIAYKLDSGLLGGNQFSAGFLFVGLLGILTWDVTLACGSSFERERAEGTIAFIFLTPASRALLTMGYGLGSFVWSLPSYVVALLTALLAGATFENVRPLSAIVSVVLIFGAAFSTGYAFAGLFVLTRRANFIVNFLQLPIYLVAGFLVPRSSLPQGVYELSYVLPISHAVEATRAALLHNATLSDMGASIAWLLATGTAAALIGFVALQKMEFAARRSGDLDLF